MRWIALLPLSLLGFSCRESNCLTQAEKQLTQEYFDESEVPNIFQANSDVSDAVQTASWESDETCHFPRANRSIQLANIREGLWTAWAYLRHSDNHLHPFVSPYDELRCLRVLTQYNPSTRRLSVKYGCRHNASTPWWWDFRFEFLANKRIHYPERYGCQRARLLHRTVIADTDYTNYLLLHGCQSNADYYKRANAFMVLVRTLNVSRPVRWAIGNYTRAVMRPETEPGIAVLNLTRAWSAGEADCDCSGGREFVFCDSKFRFRRDPDAMRLTVNESFYRCLVVVSLVALLMATVVLVEQVYTFRSKYDGTSYVFAD
uniref:SCP domain-containing protein n=1 Tax=Anopheles farauti TaxID=69004 RepID=A0A182QFU2_9DIPT